MITITSLKDTPDLYSQVIQLINTCFDYSADQSFETDFYPLVEKKSHQQNIILLKDDQLVGHIGFRIREIVVEDKIFNISLIGGISIKKEFRGQGLFKKLFTYVLNDLNKNYEIAAHILWSDQFSMYQPFAFYPCGEQIALKKNNYIPIAGYKKTNFSKIELKTKKQIKNLYEKTYAPPLTITLNRKKTWKDLEKINSADLYLKFDQNNNLLTYFIMNKGKDLSGIIYEIGTSLNFEHELKQISQFAETWIPVNFHTTSLSNYEYQYQFCLKAGDVKYFRALIKAISNGQIKNLKIENNMVDLFVKNQKSALNIKDFIEGFFGPNRFEEFQNYPQLYITGFDSL